MSSFFIGGIDRWSLETEPRSGWLILAAFSLQTSTRSRIQVRDGQYYDSGISVLGESAQRSPSSVARPSSRSFCRPARSERFA